MQKIFFTLFLLGSLLSPVASFSQNLSLTWSKAFSNPLDSIGGGATGWATQRNGNGDIYVVGNFSRTADFDPGPGSANLTSLGSSDIFIAKYDANGNYIFARSFGGPGAESPFSLAIDAAGYLYMTGGFNGTSDFDPGAGVASRTSVEPLGDIFIAKYDADGNYVYANAIGGSMYDEGTSIKVDAGGNVYATGYFTGTPDFDPGPGVVNLTATGGSNIYLVKYDSNGDYVFAKNIAGSDGELGNGLVLDGSDNIYITGEYRGTVDFDPSAGVANLTSAGASDIFLAKYDANGNYIFAKSMGGTNSQETFDITIDASGNIYMTGEYSGTPDMDPGPGVANLPSPVFGGAFFAKYDANGNYIFAYGVGPSSSTGHRICLDASGNIFLIGYFLSTVDFDPGPGVANLVSAGTNDAFLAKYDANGNYIFANRTGGPGADNAWGIFIDGSGNANITGNFQNAVDFDPGPGTANLDAGGGSNAYLASYTGVGDYRFAGKMGRYSAYVLPDNSYDVVVDGSGNSYITGSFTGMVDFDPGVGVANLSSIAPNTADIFIAKYDASGNYVYARSMGGVGTDIGYNLSVDGSGNVYVTGLFAGTVDFDPGAAVAYLVSAGGNDIFFAKYDASGNYVYARSIGGTGTDNSTGLSVDGSGNIYITGYYTGTVDFDPGAGVVNLVSTVSSDDIFIAKYDASGNYVYAKSIGGTSNDNGSNIQVDAGGNVYVTGRFSGTADFNPAAAVVNLVSAGGYDIFIAKYDASGNYVYAKRMGGTIDDYATNLFADGSGNLFITGYFQSTADFDPGAAVVNLVSAGGNDIFIAKYDVNGNYVNAKSAGGTNNDLGNSIKPDGSGNIYITGNFIGTADLDPGAATNNLVSTGATDIFIAKYDAAMNYVYAKKIGGTTSDNGNSITLDGTGKVYVTGNFTGTADFDPNANTQLQSAWNNSDIYLVKLEECVLLSLPNYSASSIPTTISGTTIMTDGGCSLITTIIPNGASPISGTVNAKVWIENTVPVLGSDPFVARHYEITPTTNPSTSTAKVTLYFTQQEFDDFNAHPASGLDLPTGPGDVIGIANLRVGKYAGISSDGSGLPGTYPGSVQMINPVDLDISWNISFSRWEVSFDVTGFSGFIVQTKTSALPLTLLAFNGHLNNNNAVLNWKTTGEYDMRSYEIERSTDGRTYAAVGSVAALNQPGSNLYTYTDNNITSSGVAVVYYRIKQNDINGRVTYSGIVALSIDRSKNIVLFYPNPVITKANLTITINKPGQLVLKIFDNTGRLLQQQQMNLVAGSNMLPVDVKDLANGVYYLELKGGIINEHIPFVKNQ